MKTKIIGVMMVKNEDRFVGAALRNILGFCDKIIVIDTGSVDKTLERVQEIIDANYCDVTIVHEHNLIRTHSYIEHYARTDTWIFGVDGDEIYDFRGLSLLRTDLIENESINNKINRLRGKYLHVTSLDKNMATGYMGPPSHNPTKLYNMKQVVTWPSDGVHSLFHPKTRQYVPGTRESKLLDPDGWDNCDLKCLHMRFLTRSSLEVPEEDKVRLNPEDRLGFGSIEDHGGRRDRNERLSYQRGTLVTVPIAEFGIVE